MEIRIIEVLLYLLIVCVHLVISLPYNSCRTCLANHMGFISYHITPLVIYSLGGGQTNTHTVKTFDATYTFMSFTIQSCNLQSSFESSTFIYVVMNFCNHGYGLLHGYYGLVQQTVLYN